MKLARITIEIEITPDDQDIGLGTHANEWIYEGGMWTFNGPVKSSVTAVTHEIYRMLTAAMQNAG